MKNRNNLVVIIICITITILGLMLYLKPLSNFFELEPMNLIQLSISISIGFVSVIWFELFKWKTRIKSKPVLGNK